MLLIRDVEVAGATGLDVRVADGVVEEIGSGLRRRPGEEILEGGGGALLAGLHDHHLHLRSLAASGASVRCGPPEVNDRGQLADALATAAERLPPGGWLRGVGYHESVAGELDRWDLDAMVGERAARIQHRSGRLWVFNSAAVAQTPLGGGQLPAGAEADAEGRPNGRLLDLDDWVRDHVPPPQAVDLAEVSRQLGRFGVTSVTDATWRNSLDDLEAMSCALAEGVVSQALTMMGSEDLLRARRSLHPVTVGPLKIVLHDHDPEPLDTLVARVHASHRNNRAVAFHCVTAAELVLALASLEEAGALDGDRIEHAAVAPGATLARVRRLGVAVVTQPHFVVERGESYVRDLDGYDLADLYRARTLLRSGIALAGGSDAPFGGADPWAAMRAAVTRTTPSGHTLGANERLSAEEALGLFSGGGRLGGRAPALTVGMEADHCLLSVPWAEGRRLLSSEAVLATVRAGRVVHRAAESAESALEALGR